MADLGYATIPRGMRIPILSFGNLLSGQLSNGHSGGTSSNVHTSPPHVPVVGINSGLSTGSVTANGSTGVRTVHDGFATIRSGGSKRGRSRSSPSVVGENRIHQCHYGCCQSLGRTWGMEPLWEERASLEPSSATQVTRRERQQLPWWEIATRRSRYRSCPAFSQASVVNALEQTMSDVTNRLERLASSPDLKESEAAELRMTAALLRQQSTAMCQSVSSGYFTMERQLSCDSVSSVASTVSGASLSSFASMPSRSLPGTLSQHFNHNHFHRPADTLTSTDSTKIKKRSWLRSSFRRAFGRNSRKRSKQTIDGNVEESNELPMHHTVNSAVKQLSPPPPPPPPPRCYTLMKPHSTLKSFGKDIGRQNKDTKINNEHQSSQEESTLITRLQKNLAEKERELTDCRLEVLSTQHQLHSQADTITRLQAEVAGLKDENNKLLSLIRGQCNSSADAHLTPLSHNITTLTLNPGSMPGNNIAAVSGHHVKVMVVDQSDVASANISTIVNSKPSHLTHIGNINVESKTTWEEFDKLIANTLKDYGNRIDPVSALGLESESILCYRVDAIIRAPDLPLPELLPYGYFVGNIDDLHIWLKGGNQKKDGENVGDVSLAAFSSVTPASSLKHLACQLTEHRRLLLAGPSACGKSSLAQTLAQFYITNSFGEHSCDAIKSFKVTGSNTLELCQLLSNIWSKGFSSSSQSTSSISSNISISSSSLNSAITSPDDSGTPYIIIIDDVHQANEVVETLQRCLPTSVSVGPAIIATCCPTSTLCTRLNINCNFKWATLSIQQEPIRGLLGRVLRRRVVAAEVASNTRLPDAHHLAEWLTRLWLHLNTVLSGHCSSHDVGVGPGLLMDSPLGQEETQIWFTEVWNSRLVPYIKKTLRTSSSVNTSIFDTWTDPLDWVLATYPWPVNAVCCPDQLTRITSSDIGKWHDGVSSQKLSCPEPYVPLSIRQQVQKSESIYSTPQLLHLGGLTRPGIQGTGQTVISQETQPVNPCKPISKLEENSSERNECTNVFKNKEQVQNIDNTVLKDYELSRNMISKIFTGGSDTSNHFLSKSREKSENIDEKFLEYKTSTNNLNENSKMYNSPRSSLDNDKNAKPEVQDEGVEQLENTAIPLPLLFNDCTSSFTNNVIVCKDIAMDTDHNNEQFDSNSGNLNISSKNTINFNGLANDCVEIISETDPTTDIRDLSLELTSTLKPSETSM